MATFTGKSAIIEKSAAEVAEKFSDLSRMQTVLDNLPEDQRSKVGDVELTKDKISIKTQQVGEVSFVITERSAERIVFNAVGSPVPMNLFINLTAVAENRTELVTVMDVEIPAFLKPMVGGAMQKAVDQFGVLMQQLA